jgi:predicted CoA-binding protein
MMTHVHNLINEFLDQKRFAIVGISRNLNEFSRMLMGDFVRRGYDIVPVNPNVEQIDGRKCFARVQDIEPPITAALIIVPKEMAEIILHDCAEAGITLVWMYGISGSKDLPSEAQKICDRHGMKLVPGYCPFMFMDGSAWYHRFHGLVWKAIGLYPN